MRPGFIAACVSSVMLAGLAAPVYAQSLADLAKKEEERRKAISQPSKVYTNKDLGTPPTPSTPPPAGGASAPSPVASSSAGSASAAPGAAPSGEKSAESDKDAAAAPKQPVKDQAYWSGRKKALIEKADRDQTYSDALQSRINALATDFVNRDDPFQRSVIERDRLKAIAELNRLKQQILDDKKAIADLDEEARRAGVPPGWLR